MNVCWILFDDLYSHLIFFADKWFIPCIAPLEGCLICLCQTTLGKLMNSDIFLNNITYGIWVQTVYVWHRRCGRKKKNPVEKSRATIPAIFVIRYKFPGSWHKLLAIFLCEEVLIKSGVYSCALAMYVKESECEEKSSKVNRKTEMLCGLILLHCSSSDVKLLSDTGT